jgi:hypothetical protein
MADIWAWVGGRKKEEEKEEKEEVEKWRPGTDILDVMNRGRALNGTRTRFSSRSSLTVAMLCGTATARPSRGSVDTGKAGEARGRNLLVIRDLSMKVCVENVLSPTLKIHERALPPPSPVIRERRSRPQNRRP